MNDPEALSPEELQVKADEIRDGMREDGTGGYKTEQINTEDQCDRCNKRISRRVALFSIGQFKEQLCMNCQKIYRRENYPKKLASFINKQI